jgi:hypothetical protein
LDSKRKMTEGPMEPLFLYEYIKLEKIDEYSTYYTLIEIFPSVQQTIDNFNILKKHEGRKSRIKTLLKYSELDYFNEINDKDPLGKLLLNVIKK